MGVDELLEQREVAQAYLAHLAKCIPDACGKAGHLWTEAKRTIDHEGGIWRTPDPDDPNFSNGGHWDGGRDVVYYVRECTRCWLKEKQRAKIVELSPFQ
jgi:hypothetical protein